ncbi:putative ribonuclease H-like domain-containing protein [Tanacetum coccineum]
MCTDTNVDKPFAPNPQHEDKDLDEWLNAEMEKRMCGECKSVYTNKNIRVEAPSCGTNKVQEVSFVAEEEEGDTSGTLPCQLPPKELNPGSFTCKLLNKSDMAEEQVQTNMALIAFSDSELNLKKRFSNCRRTTSSHIEIMRYFLEKSFIHKREVACKDYEINMLKSEFEKVKHEKEGIEFKIEKFDKASKDLEKLLGSQITDKSKKGLGYNVVPPPHPLIYNRPKNLDLSYSGLDEFKRPEFKSYGSEDSKQESNIVIKKKSDDSKDNSNDSLEKEQVSEDTSSFVKSSLNVEKETVFLDKKIEFVKPKNHEKPVKKSVRYAEMYRSQSPRGNQRNWNGQKSNQLGSDFADVIKQKLVLSVNYNYTTNMIHPNAQRNMVPRAVLMKTGLKSFNTAKTVNTAHPKSTIFSAKPMSRKSGHNAVKTSACWVWRPTKPDSASITMKKYNYIDARGRSKSVMAWCSCHLNSNAWQHSLSLSSRNLIEVMFTFREKQVGGRISGKGTLKTDSLDFEDATLDESMLWHRRLSHINFKNINKLVNDNLVRGLPTKHFENDQTCVACFKGKQHRASCKSKVLNPITKPLFMLHMDLFGLTFMSSLMHKKYFLVVTDDYSRFTWVFFLASKDETSEILKNFIKEIENLVDKKVKIFRSDNGTEFKNKVMDDFYREKGIKREYSVARTPQQNGVAERRNKTLIEAARTMLADFKLHTIFWAEAVSTACYVHNRVLVVKPHNKTPYKFFRGFEPALSFMRPFGCLVTILNTLDKLGKFDSKSDEGFFVGYSLSSKDFKVYNTRTRRVEENLHIGFLENKPMIEGNGPKWLFDIDSLTQSMNYVPIDAGTITNESEGIQGELNAGTSSEKEEISQDCIVMPIWKDASYFDSPFKDVGNGEPKSAVDDQKQVEDGPDNENDEKDKSDDDSSPKEVNTAG